MNYINNDNDNDITQSKHDLFAMLMYCHDTTTQTTQLIHDPFYSDVSIKFINPDNCDQKQDEKKQHQQEEQRVVAKIGTKEEFNDKMKRIANNDDYDWVVAMMAIDDFESFVFSNIDNKEVVTKEIDKMTQEMFYLFDIYGNRTAIADTTEIIKYCAFESNHDGEFGLILYDSKDINKCYVPAHEILATLKEEICIKCQFTVSIGCSRLTEDDLGIMDDWYERVKKNLKQAKKNGKNQICFGAGSKIEDEHTELELKLMDDNHQENEIEEKSLQSIEICSCITMS